MNNSTGSRPAYFPTEKSSDSELAFFCLESSMALNALHDMLSCGGQSLKKADPEEFAKLLRLIHSPLEAAAVELHSRGMKADRAALEAFGAQLRKGRT